jgi:hypothetical protein
MANTIGLNMLEVKRINYDDLTEDEQDRQPNNGQGKEQANYLRIIHNGKTIAIRSDAMEPEDCLFYRDLSWISNAITKAYELGRIDGTEPQPQV